MKTGCFKRMLAVFMAVVMICSLIPGTALAASVSGSVHVTIENTTFTTSDAPWTGTLVDTEVMLTEDMTMLSAITTALDTKECKYTVTSAGYISKINNLAEMQNGALSGWMGTLNDWFTDTGFANYKVSDQTLCDGDVIRVMYTSTGMGTDIGSGSYGNTDTALSALSVTDGTMEPTFDPAVTAYTVTVPAGTAAVKVNATAKYKDHQVYLSVGETGYRRTAAIPVANGTAITVQCGETGSATTYTLNVKVENNSTGEGGHTDWANLTSFTEGETYYIATASDLGAFRDLVNDGNSGGGCTFILSSDIALSGVCGEEIGSWTAIGSSSTNCFSGVFDGAGYEITNLYISASSYMAGGLFFYASGATFKNLIVSGTVQNTNGTIATLVYDAKDCTFEKCINKATVEATGNLSGFVFQMSGNNQMLACENKGSITSTGAYGTASGFLNAIYSGSVYIKNCVNNGKITGAGAVGFCQYLGSGSIENCVNNAEIEGTGAYANVAGIAIGSNNYTLKNCTNNGVVSGKANVGGITTLLTGNAESCSNTGEVESTSSQTYQGAGGIAASMTSGATMTDCVNSGTVAGTINTGGLVGLVNGGATIRKSYNRGEIKSSSIAATNEGNIGGIVGAITAYAGSNVAISESYNSGNILSDTPNVGGLIGSINSTGSITIADCYNAGDVSASANAGGMIGSATTTFTMHNCYSVASTVTATDGTAGMAFGSISAASALNTSNLFVRQISDMKVAGADTLGMDINAVIPLTHAQMTDAGFVTHLGTAFAKFSTDIYNGGEYSESDWATYTEYYGDYAYPILVSTCGASPMGERCNVQFLGAQYAKVTVNGYETYATTVTPGSEVSFTIETGDPEITVTSVAVGDTTLEAVDGTYTCTVSADTIVTITLSGTMTAPGDGGGTDTPEKTGYPISFAVSDGTNPIDGVQITVTGAEDASCTPVEGIFWLDEGSYTVEATLDGYHSVKGTMTVTSGMSKEETNTLSFNLYPTSVSQRTITMNIVAASTLDTMMVYNGDLLLEQKEAADSVSFTLPAGSYIYSATKADSGYGSGPFTIADEDGQTLTLRAVDMTTYGLSNSSSVGYTVTMKAADGTEYFPGSLDAKNGGGARGWFLLPASDYGEEYHYTFNPVSDYYWGSYGVTYLYSGYVGTALRDFNGISGSQSDTGKFVIAPKTTATFTVPTGATLRVCHRVKFYEPLEVLTPSNTSEGGGVTTYTYDIPSGITLHYELEMDGYVKKAATFTGSQSISISTADLTPASSAASDIPADIDSAVLTNAPSSHYIELDVGEQFELYLHRNWQATNSITGNYYVDPTYHIEVISGSSVTVTDNYYAGATLNAVSNGVSVIRITYDALDFVNSSGESYIYSKLYEENTAVLVVNVGGNGIGTIDSGCGADEYEIQYFIRSINDTVKAEEDQYAELTFTPSTNVVSVELHAPVGSTGSWSDTWTKLEKKDNSFTAHLKEGSNVLRFTTADGTTSYHVIRAIGLDMTATGETLTVKLEDGQFVLEANTNDDLTFQFKGLQMPLPKLAALINPGLESVQNGSGWDLVESTYATYTLRGNNTEATTITGKSSQYEISTKNAITLNFATPDTYTLTEGALHTTSFGAGSYTAMTKGGYTGAQSSFRVSHNTTLDTRKNLYSAMPDLTIRVATAEDRTAAEAVEALIDTIGEVTLDSKDAIEAAEKAYNELTPEQQKLVSNYQTLLDARAAYDKLVEEAEKPTDPVTPVDPVIPSEPTKPTTPTEPTEPETPVAGMSFSDVSTGDWFYEDVAYVYAAGLMNGMGNGKFAPDVTTTRGMIVTILYRLEGEPSVSGSCPFGDVNSGSYYEKAIAWAAANDIVNGYGNGRFGPNDPITREQMAVILCRYAQYKKLDVSVGEDTNILSFHDVSEISEYAFSAMQWACGDGIMQGDNGNLMPRGNATRAQIAALLHRFCEEILK